MKRWKILHTGDKEITNSQEVIEVLLANRGIDKKVRQDFLNPSLDAYNTDNIGLDKKEVNKFIARIKTAITKEETIVVFGDYDVDGICASAILWETLYKKTKKVHPYIPDRIEEGYGLSIKGIENVLVKHPETSLIVTVDNGIVAHDAVSFAKEKGIEVVVTDHHVKSEKLPDAFCILHTTQLCGAGIAWFLSKELQFEKHSEVIEKLELACLATVADLVPLVNVNRAIVKNGIDILRSTKRVGLIELLKEAGIEKSSVGVYTIGHIIAPRLNATGRIQSAMNALRLLCTTNREKAKELAVMLSSINKDRQGMTEESVLHAKLLAVDAVSRRITVVAHESYNQGVIGLVASQLVEMNYKPSFAIAKGGKVSKGSARSIAGVNIIELLRSVDHTLLEAGGHPMAAGFSLETERIGEFIEALSKKADEIIGDELLERTITIDAILPFQIITQSLYEGIAKLSPFGMANPEPVFGSEKISVLEARKIGKESNHLKMKLEKDGKVFDAIGFRMADKTDVFAGDEIDVAYTIDENEWNGKKNLQLKIRDLKVR